MSDGTGSKSGGRANFQDGEYIFKMDSSTASTVDTTPVFAKQVIGVINGATASAIETLGTLDTPTSLKLIYTAAAANTNFLGVGSMIHFYAPVDGEWLVNTYNIPEGTGATGAWTTASS